MKHMKKIISLLLMMVMAMSMTATVFAKNVTVGEGNGTITISNAAKGESYKLYKLFDATVTGKVDGSIAYTGEVPDELTMYFEKDEAGNITATEAATNSGTKDMSEGLRKALESWTKKAVVLKETTADGTTLNFTEVSYGYYVVTTTQGQQAISVDSTNPNATIVDKNSTVPNGLSKEVSIDNKKVEDVNIGDFVTYTVSFQTSNYDGEGADAKEIISYTIKDSLPEFLADVQVKEIVIDDDGDLETTKDQTMIVSVSEFDKKDNSIVLKWYDQEQKRFLYTNGATVYLTYTATVTEKAVIDGAGNINTVTVTWNTYNPEKPEGDQKPEEDKLEATSPLYTYAIAFKKVDQNGHPLAGAEFELPFYVKKDSDGTYIYAGTKDGEGLVNKVTTSYVNPEGSPADSKDGLIVIKGVSIPKADSLSGEVKGYVIKETKAPNGYNKLPGDSTFEVMPQKTGAEVTSKTIYLNENGEEVKEASETTSKIEVELPISATVKVVVNKLGIELPETGDIGTTIFYVVGGLLAVSGSVALIMRKHMNREN